VLAFVQDVIDGDTIRVDTGNDWETVRFIGVDTPELAHHGQQQECFAAEAAAFTQQLGGDTIWLTFDNDCADDYGRTLAYVHIGATDQDFFERLLLREGYARHLYFAETGTFGDTFERDEALAQERSAGMWGACR